MKPSFDVLFEDNHLLVVSKPPLLPTMGVSADKPSLLSEAKRYIAAKYHKPGNVYLGVVSRLDAPVTGVLVVARTSKAASRLTAEFRQGKVTKTYLALVEGTYSRSEIVGRYVDWMRKDERHRKMHITHQSHPEAKQAALRYRQLCGFEDESLLEVVLETGRKHQIRVQLAHRGHTIVGDRKYGSTIAFPAGIALHSHRIELEHPVRKTPLVIEAPLPNTWPRNIVASLAFRD